MDNIFEKITLYDILGYFFPGVFFFVIVLATFWKSVSCIIPVLLEDLGGICIIAFIVVSHIMGILLSETSKIILDIKCFKKVDYTITDDLVNKMNGTYKIYKYPKCYIDKDLKNAFEKSEVSYFSDKEDSRELTKQSMGYIYSVIQTDSNYSRIHTYASASVMCRNTATAALLGCVMNIGIIILNTCHNTGIMVYQVFMTCILLISAMLLYKRGNEFVYKKYYYAVNWFIQKYNSK